ncbi:MAG: hypothetical protein INR69_11100 [Mucilaginibacter polytrichastri]|nr:hypothetical protein [Mucilaginibacter polytrichastri]
MPSVILIHNASAGDELLSADELRLKITAVSGLPCTVITQNEMDDHAFLPEEHQLVIAGGDGTVRRVVQHLREKYPAAFFPLLILPMGTANNIARALSLPKDPNVLLDRWDYLRLVSFDTGMLDTRPPGNFFLESCGFGIFPEVMHSMKHVPKDKTEDAEGKKEKGLLVMDEIVRRLEPFAVQVTLDGKDHSGKYLMVEVLNTPSFGSNVMLSPEATVFDGELELLLLSEEHRDMLGAYLHHKLSGRDPGQLFETFMGKSVTITADAPIMHIDDELINIDRGTAITANLSEGLFQFYV